VYLVLPHQFVMQVNIHLLVVDFKIELLVSLAQLQAVIET